MKFGILIEDSLYINHSNFGVFGVFAFRNNFLWNRDFYLKLFGSWFDCTLWCHFCSILLFKQNKFHLTMLTKSWWLIKLFANNAEIFINKFNKELTKVDNRLDFHHALLIYTKLGVCYDGKLPAQFGAVPRIYEK